MSNKELITKLNIASKLIHEKSLRGNGNFIIVNSQIAELIDNIDKMKLRDKKLKKIMKRLNENSINN